MTNSYDKTLKTWDHPTGYDSDANFIGYKPKGYVIYSRNRDSSILENTNFDGILADLGGESDTVEVVRHRHWACGWIEYIVVSQESPAELLDQCVAIVQALDAYPIFNEDRYGEAQTEAIDRYWSELSIRERVTYCADNGESIFAARHDSIPDRVFEQLMSEIY
jgi:hypothetical protein